MMSLGTRTMLLWLLFGFLFSHAIRIPCKPGNDLKEDFPDLDTLLSTGIPVENQSSTEVADTNL